MAREVGGVHHIGREVAPRTATLHGSVTSSHRGTFTSSPHP